MAGQRMGVAFPSIPIPARTGDRAVIVQVGHPAGPVARIAAAVVTGAIFVVCVVVFAQELVTMAGNRSLMAVPGLDYSSYMDATRRWLAGGSFYESWQLAGPYAIAVGDILYPPQMLALFVPFTVLPWPLWYGIPTAITVGSIAACRPAAWAWVAMLLVVTLWVGRFQIWWFGTPTIWFVALVALGLRYAPVAALVFLKPSIAPLALLGMRNPRWWLASLAVAASCLLCWPLFEQWVTAILNVRGTDALYSIGDVAPLSIPVIAWAGRRRHGSSTDLTGRRGPAIPHREESALS